MVAMDYVQSSMLCVSVDHSCGFLRQGQAVDIHGNAVKAALEAGTTRFRPVIMPALAMMASLE